LVKKVPVPVPESRPTLEGAIKYLWKRGQQVHSLRLDLKLTDPYNSDDPGWIFVVSGSNPKYVEEAAQALRDWDGY